MGFDLNFLTTRGLVYPRRRRTGFWAREHYAFDAIPRTCTRQPPSVGMKQNWLEDRENRKDFSHQRTSSLSPNSAGPDDVEKLTKVMDCICGTQRETFF